MHTYIKYAIVSGVGVHIVDSLS